LDWTKLASQLDGQLVLPADASYDSARLLFDPRFDAINPAAIARCANAQDVAASLQFAREHGVPIAPRGGGHSYAGYSTGTGLVIDTGPMNSVNVDDGAGRATVGAGTRLIDLYSALAAHGVAVPGGSCATVGIAGLTLGGGIGVIGRKFGLTCDNLAQADLVTADGTAISCSADANSDLLWACQGGGGGNFGIVTAFHFATHAIGNLTTFSLSWPWSAAHDVLAAWQEWAPNAPDELWSNCLLVAGPDPAGTPSVLANGVYVGGAGPLNALIDQLAAQSGNPPERYVNAVGYLDAMLIEAGCSGKSVAQCHLPSQDPAGTLSRESSHAKSDFFSTPLPDAAIAACITNVEARQADPALANGGVAFDALGGAINRVDASATAFVHRSALFDAQYSGSWTSGGAATDEANKTWVEQVYAALHPYADGGAYINYIDPDQPDWQQAYYGANLGQLKAVKKKYDPDNVFNFAQGVPVG
jgi:FAD/FMN-containing dehydrogenase